MERKKKPNPEMSAMEKQGREMCAVLRAAVPSGVLKVAGREYTLEDIGQISIPCLTVRRAQRTITPCLKAKVAGHPEALVYAIVWVEGFKAKSIDFYLENGKITHLRGG